MRREVNILGLLEPNRWEFDGDLRRKEPVRDALNGNRVVRYSGYRRCLTCTKVFWSENVCSVRMCHNCKTLELD